MHRGLARRVAALALTVSLLSSPAYADPVSILVGIGLSTAAATAITSAVTTAIVGSVISYGVAAIAGAISKNKQPGIASYAWADAAGARVNISKSSVETHKIIYGRVRVSGPLVYVNTTDGKVSVADVQGQTIKRANVLHLVIPLACHEVEEIETVYLDEVALELDGDGFATNDGYISTYPRPNGTTKHVLVKKHLGTPDQEADPDLMEAVSDWTAAHRLRGIAYIYVRLTYYGYNTAIGGAKLFPNGVPQISAIVKGKKVYDPRTGLDAYSANWALCVRDYLSDIDYGLGATDAEIDDDSVTASANICDEDVELADGTTQTRYECNGVIDTANNPSDIMKDLCSAGAGTVPYTQGRFRVFAGAYTAPSATMDETWLAGELGIQARTPRQELFNAVKGVYVAPDKQWQPTDFPKVTNAIYVAQDDGLEIARDLELPFTIDPVMAQRIAKITLEKARQGIIVTAPCNWMGLQAAIWDTVELSISRLGWDHKVFRVTGWELSPEAVINLTLQEESSESYDWNQGEATTYDPAPDTNLPDPRDVDPPGNPVVVESLYETTDGSGVKTQAYLSWADSESAFVNTYGVRYKLKDADDEAYIYLPDINSNQTIIYDLAPGIYDFGIRAVNRSGVASEYATTRKEIYGLSSPPSDISGFKYNILNGQLLLEWESHPDADVRIGGTIKIKTSLSYPPNWSTTNSVIQSVPGNATSVTLPALNGYYMIKAFDSTGHECVNAASLVVFSATNDQWVSTGEKFPTYDGYDGEFINCYTKPNYFVPPDWGEYGTNALFLDPLGNFDDYAGNFDDTIGEFDDGGGTGFVDYAEFIFPTYDDSSYVQNWLISGGVIPITYDGLSLFDSADGLFGDREGRFDGEDISNSLVEMWVKTTTSDPTGSSYDDGIWSEWTPFTVTELSARAFWFKLTIQNPKASNQVIIDSFNISFYKKFRNEAFANKFIDAAGTTLTLSTVFLNVAATVNIQSSVSGDEIKITRVFGVGTWITGITVQILNGGVGVNRTCDINVTGY